MDLIFEQLQIILKQQVAILGAFRNLVVKAKEDIDKSKRIQIECYEKLEALEVREKVVREKEGTLLSAEEIQKAKDVLEKEKSVFAKEKKEAEKKLSEVRAVLSDREANVASQEKDLARRERELAEEKETYKKKILGLVGK